MANSAAIAGVLTPSKIMESLLARTLRICVMASGNIVPAQARRADGVRLSTETRSRGLDDGSAGLERSIDFANDTHSEIEISKRASVTEAGG